VPSKKRAGRRFEKIRLIGAVLCLSLWSHAYLPPYLAPYPIGFVDEVGRLHQGWPELTVTLPQGVLELADHSGPLRGMKVGGYMRQWSASIAQRECDGDRKANDRLRELRRDL
jgi:hypothetical protein